MTHKNQYNMTTKAQYKSNDKAHLSSVCKEDTAPVIGALLFPFLFPITICSSHFTSISCLSICQHRNFQNLLVCTYCPRKEEKKTMRNTQQEQEKIQCQIGGLYRGGRLTLKGHLRTSRVSTTIAHSSSGIIILPYDSVRGDISPQVSTKCLYSLTPTPCHCHLQ